MKILFEKLLRLADEYIKKLSENRKSKWKNFKEKSSSYKIERVLKFNIEKLDMEGKKDIITRTAFENLF